MNQAPTNPASGSQPSLFRLDPANSYPIFAHLRALGAVVPIPIPAASQRDAVWLVTHFDEAVQVLKDPRFTVDASALDAPVAAKQSRRRSA